MNEKLEKLIAEARARYENMTDAEKLAVFEEQARSFARAEIGFGTDANELQMREAIRAGRWSEIARLKLEERARMTKFDELWPEAQQQLWLLGRIATREYDCNHGLVVRAGGEAEARYLASKRAGYEGAEVWLSSSGTFCRPLLNEGESGVILVDFCAG